MKGLICETVFLPVQRFGYVMERKNVFAALNAIVFVAIMRHGLDIYDDTVAFNNLDRASVFCGLSDFRFHFRFPFRGGLHCRLPKYTLGHIVRRVNNNRTFLYFNLRADMLPIRDKFTNQGDKLRDFITTKEMVLPLRTARKLFLKRYFIAVANLTDCNMDRMAEVADLSGRGAIRRQLMSLDLWPRVLLESAVKRHIKARHAAYLRFNSGTKNRRNYHSLKS